MASGWAAYAYAISYTPHLAPAPGCGHIGFRGIALYTLPHEVTVTA